MILLFKDKNDEYVTYLEVKRCMLSSLTNLFNLTWPQLDEMDFSAFSNNTLQTVHNYVSHPVHIFDENDSLSPSAFIPFCQIGVGNSYIGKKNNQFRFPVCSRFKRKLLFNQLCYEIDMDNLKKSSQVTSEDLSVGLTMLIDLNHERHFSKKEKVPEPIREDIGLYHSKQAQNMFSTLVLQCLISSKQ